MLVLLLAAGGFLAFLPPEHAMATAARLRSTVLLPVLEAHEVLHVRTRLRERLAAVRAERDALARELVRARSEARETRQLRDLLELPARASPRMALAELEPGRVRAGGSRTFLLYAGPDVRVPAPTGVFTARGLVGVVRSVGGGAAAGDFWTHPDFRVSVRTGTGEASGIVRPTFETGQPGMILEGAPYQQDIPPGTMLFTTGLGGIYPAGLPVGTVRSVSGVESGWERSYRVEPAIRPGEVDVTLVWLGPGETEGAGRTAEEPPTLDLERPAAVDTAGTDGAAGAPAGEATPREPRPEVGDTAAAPPPDTGAAPPPAARDTPAAPDTATSGGEPPDTIPARDTTPPVEPRDTTPPPDTAAARDTAPASPDTAAGP